LAALAGSKDVHDVLGIPIAVFGSNGLCPSFHFSGLNLCGCPTHPANQVVVVSRRARAVKVFALDAERVSASLLGKSVQRPIDRGQPNGRPTASQLLVQLLSAHKLWRRLKDLPDFFPLFRVALHGYFS
jgi:hypothetical protein